MEKIISPLFGMSEEEQKEYIARLTAYRTTDKDELLKMVDEDIQCTENYVARELYKIFARDDFQGFCDVRKQILKKQTVDYFKEIHNARLEKG